MTSRPGNDRRAIAPGMLASLLLVAISAWGGPVAGDAPAGAHAPHVVAPPSNAGPAFSMAAAESLPAAGYVEQEFFIEGEASAYTAPLPLAGDGRWAATPGLRAPYRTRLLVRRPADATRFSGTVIVEWLNVTAGSDGAPDWTFAYREILRSGHAWVGVSAQWVGVASRADVRIPTARGSLQVIDPVRYGSLVHPGDAFSYDIFSQAGRALRTPGGLDPLRGLRVAALIAAGESQSASRMVTYINAVHPLARVYDGFLVHSRSAGAAPLSQSLAAREGSPPSAAATPNIAVAQGVAVPIRDDTGVPVFVVQAETDVPNALGARQADSTRMRTWELAGTAHADAWLVSGGSNAELLTDAICDAARTPALDVVPINAGPHTYGLRSALHHLEAWVRRGTPPPVAPSLEMDGQRVARDSATALARGGVRLPQVEVPRWTLRGDRERDGNSLCFLFGRTDPWNGDADPWDGTPADPSPTPEPDLRALYPASAAYLARFEAATDAAIASGFLLAADRDEVLGVARGDGR
jgi:hypothetical protein